MSQISPERCQQLRALHTRLTDEIKHLQQGIQQAQVDGVANPIEMLTTLKHLKASLQTVLLELAQCPPEAEPESARLVPARQQAKQTLRTWFKDGVDVNVHDDEGEPERLIDDER